MKSLKVKSKTGIERSIAGFGAALSTLVLAPNVEAMIVNLTPTPGSQPYLSTATIDLGIPGGNLDFFQFNDTAGKTLVGSSTAYDIYGFRPAPFGSAISSGQSFSSYLSIGLSASGTATFGFLTNAGQVGWIQMNLGGAGGTILYLAAAFETDPGVPIVSGDVPEPDTLPLAGLGLLAMGAAGVRARRREKKRAQAAQN